MAIQMECPSCGASVKVKRGREQLECSYCGSTFMVPPEYRKAVPVQIGMSSQAKGCSAAIIVVVASLLVGVVGLIVFLVSKDSPVRVDVGSIMSGGPAPVLEFGGEGITPGRFEDPRNIAVDGDGNIYVAEYGTGRIQVFDSSGEYITEWSLEGENIYIQDMDCSRDGVLYISIWDGIHVYDGMTGEEQKDELQHPEGYHASNMAIAPDGSMVVAWSHHDESVSRFDPEGTIDLTIEEVISSRTGDSELDMYVAVDAQGNIFVLGTFNDVVVIYDSDGVYQNRFGSDDPDVPGSFSMPTGIVTDALGRILVTDTDGILVFDPGGTYMGTLPVRGWHVFGMCVDEDNLLYTVTNDSMVYVYDLDDIEPAN
jgi:DNA-binding beta-propeller fold protein YncE